MHLETKNIIGKKILLESSGQLIALLNLPIINPDTGVIEAFWVKSGLPGLQNAILQVSDIRAFKKSLYISTESKLADPAQVIRIAKILEQNKPYFGQNVLGTSKKDYGVIWNISFSNETYLIKQLFTKKLLGLKKHIFTYKQITEVKAEYILVNDDSSQKAVNSTPEVG